MLEAVEKGENPYVDLNIFLEHVFLSTCYENYEIVEMYLEFCIFSFLAPEIRQDEI